MKKWPFTDFKCFRQCWTRKKEGRGGRKEGRGGRRDEEGRGTKKKEGRGERSDVEEGAMRRMKK